MHTTNTTLSPAVARSESNQRRHDLDAVRSFAMLLGVLLHAALAYMGSFWIVNDTQTSGVLAILVAAIHGFRMPLFFLLSGFFTAMLWRKRGVSGMLKHRALRIGLPLALGCVTLVPAVSLVSGWAISVQAAGTGAEVKQGAAREAAPSNDIWTLAAYGDLEGMRALKPEGALLDQPDPKFGVTPLGWAALQDQPEVAAYLLEAGANPNARYRDQNTPMHTACFFGRAAVAELLVAAGADLSARSAMGELPLDTLKHDQGVTEFIAGMLSVSVDFERVSAGRDQIRELTDTSAAAPEEQSVGGWLHASLYINFFHHLWFLWFLCILIVGFVLLASAASWLPSFAAPAWLFTLPGCLLWLLPLSMTTQWFMQAAGPGFGPDVSTAIVPTMHVLAHYAIFFGFGALVFLVRGADLRFAPRRAWAVLIPVAIPLFFIGLNLEFTPETATYVASDLAKRVLSDFTQVAYAWLMVFGVIALFETWLHRERAWVRYLSDSCYWVYLAHLPLVIVGQALLLSFEFGPLVKTMLLTSVITGGLLVLYHFGVRYTVVGTILNGKRTRPTDARSGLAESRETALAEAPSS